MIFIVIAGMLFLLDTVVKLVMEKTMTEHVRVPICGGRLFLTKHHNHGAFLSLGEKRFGLIKLVSIVLTGFCTLVYVLTLGRHGQYLMKTGLTLLLGGSFSNTCDRLTRRYVVDYFGFNVKNERFRNIIFNISDFFIMIGAMLSVIALPAGK